MPGTPPLNRPETLLAEFAQPRDKARVTPDWPSFSIVIPTYQRRDVVSEAVRALAKLDYAGRLELIVVVDGSTDGTAEALRGVECPFPVRVIEQPNGGAAHARNRGAAEAGNDVILFLDDDMICDPNLVREHARLYLDGAEAVIGDTPIDPQSPPGFLPQSVGRWIATKAVAKPALAVRHFHRPIVRPPSSFRKARRLRHQLHDGIRLRQRRLPISGSGCSPATTFGTIRRR